MVETNPIITAKLILLINNVSSFVLAVFILSIKSVPLKKTDENV